jgi:large subunit ribosomal protein L4
MNIELKNQNGDNIGTVDIDENVFDVPLNKSLIHQVIVSYQANQRQGTASTKTRAQVSGGGRKPWIQKHTGRARQGSIRSPQWRHGGVVFGPHPRDFRQKINKRNRRDALRCILSERVRAGGLICIDSFSELDGKTKSMVSLLSQLQITGSCLIVTEHSSPNVYQSGKNVPKVWTLPVNQINANEIISKKTVVITKDALLSAQELLSSDIVRGLNKIANAERKG